MKKLLIATTALVGTASVAAADITFSGYGRFGIQHDENRIASSPAQGTQTIAPNGDVLDADGIPTGENTGVVTEFATSRAAILRDGAGAPIDINGDPLTIDAATGDITDINGDPAAVVPIYAANAKDAEETRIESRFRLNIAASTETDGGVRFAALVRGEANEAANGSASALSWSGPRFQVSAGGLRVQVGNLSGVTDSGEITNTFGFEPGLTGKTGHYATFGGQVLGAYDAFSSTGAGNQGISVKYEMGDFAVMASWNDDFDDKDPATAAGTDRETWEIGAAYTFSGWTVGALYGNGDYGDEGPVLAVLPDGSVANLQGLDYDWWILTATGSIGAADVAVFVGDTDVDGDSTAYGISGSYPVSAATDVVASVAGGGFDDLDTAWGIGFEHNLGGGVSLKGMAGQNAFGNNIADLGVVFNF